MARAEANDELADKAKTRNELAAEALRKMFPDLDADQCFALIAPYEDQYCWYGSLDVHSASLVKIDGVRQVSGMLSSLSKPDVVVMRFADGTLTVVASGSGVTLGLPEKHEGQARYTRNNRTLSITFYLRRCPRKPSLWTRLWRRITIVTS